MLNRYSLGSNIFSITERLTVVENTRTQVDLETQDISRSLRLSYARPSTLAWIDENKYVNSRNLYDVILPKADQTTITQNPDNSITIGVSQDMGITSTPQFAGLGINGDITVTGTIDGVDLSVLQSSFTSHVFNNTTAHFGQDLTNTGEPTFKRITLTQYPTADSDAVPKGYVDEKSGALKSVKSFYDPVGGLPISPTVGDKYISSGTAYGWTANYIYEWGGTVWVEKIPFDGYQIFIEGGTLYPRKYVTYDVSSWVLFDTIIAHQSISGAGTNTHTDIDNHLANTTTAHFGQELKNTSSPTFAIVNISNPPTELYHTASKAYVDSMLQGIEWHKPVNAFYDPTSGIPLSPSVGDRYISLATANGWTVNYVYEYTPSLTWTETIPNDVYATYVEGGTYYSHMQVMFNGTIWIKFGPSTNHIALQNVGINTHPEIDAHIWNTTNAHFGQDLSSTGTPTFNSLILANTKDSTSTSTGTLVITGGFGVSGTTNLNHLNVNSITHATDALTGCIVLSGGVGINDNLHVGTTANVHSTLDAISLTSAALIVEGGVAIHKSLLVGSQLIVSSTEDTTSSSTGSLIINGGIGVGGSISLTGGLTVNGTTILNGTTAFNNTPLFNTDVMFLATTASTSATTGSLLVSGGVGVENNLFVAGNVSVGGTLTLESGSITFNRMSLSDTTDSTSASTGTLIVSGGAGIEKNLNIGLRTTTNSCVVSGTDDATDTSTGVMLVNGGAVFDKNVFMKYASVGDCVISNTTNASPTEIGALHIYGGATIEKCVYAHNAYIYSTDDSTSISTGSLIILGGVGIDKSVYIGENLTVTGLSEMSSLNLTTAIDSTDTLTGVLTIAGGIGIGQNANIGSNTHIYGTTQSTSSSTGALIVDGGMGLVGNLYVGGSLDIRGSMAFDAAHITSTVESTSVTTGAFIVDGGIGIAKSLNIGDNTHIYGTTQSTSSSTGTLIVDGGIGLAGNLYVGGSLDIRGSMAFDAAHITSTVESTSITTGAFIVDGGVGIAKSVNIGDNAHIYGTTQSTSSTTGALIIDGGLGLSGNLFVGGSLDIRGSMAFDAAHIVSTAESTSVTTGAFIVDGGVGIAKNLNVGGVITTYNTSDTTSSSTGSLIITGGLGINKNLFMTGYSMQMQNTWGTSTKQIIQLNSPILINSGATTIVYSLTVTKPVKMKITLMGTDQATGIYNFICDTIYKFSFEGTSITSMCGDSGTESLNWSHYLTGWRFSANAFSFTDNGSGNVDINYTHTGVRSDVMQINTIKISHIIARD